MPCSMPIAAPLLIYINYITFFLKHTTLDFAENACILVQNNPGPVPVKRRKKMKILLWIVQILLALWNLTGGSYTISNYEKLKAPGMNALPSYIWVALGALQVLAAIALVLPGKLVRVPKLNAIAAAYIALYALSGIILFAQYAGFPAMLWAVIPAALAAFVVYGRLTLKP